MFSRGHQSPSAAGSSNAPLASTGNQQHQDGAHAAGLPHHEKPVQKIRSMLDVDEPVNTQHHSASGTPQYNAPSSQQSREAHPSAAPVMSSGRVEERHQNTTVAPAVTHETIKPVKHEIIEEQITRDIHTHEVRTVIQPIYEVEVRPARHYVPGPDGKLVEVAEKDLPDCTGPNQRWFVGQKEPDAQPALSKPLPPLPTVENTGERTTQGFTRTEETIVHEPVWAKPTRQV